MNQPATYTPLESLFLFQSLLTQGVDTEAFTRISESLRSNALVKSDRSFDAARLAPDALQQLFWLLLQDEAKSEAELADANANSNATAAKTNPSATTTDAQTNSAYVPTSPASRKRKLDSPPLPSLIDVYEHIENVPALLDRLYARYRDTVVTQIREDEQLISSIQKDISLLERSEKERLAKAAAIQNGTPALAPRDGSSRPGLAPSVAGQTPTTSPSPAAAQAGGTRRGPSTTTPVYPPKPPSAPPTQTPVAAPSRLPSGTPPVRPSPSPKPPNAPGSGLQPPAGMPQPGSRVLQAPAPASKPALSPRPSAPAIASKPKEATPTPPLSSGAAGAAVGSLKWEKPYQPPAAQAISAQGQTQPASSANAATGPPKESQQQFQQAQHTAQKPNAAGHARLIPGKPVPVAPQNAGQLSTPLQPAPPRPVAGAAPPQGQQQPRPISTTPVALPGRPIQLQQPQQPQQPQTTPRPIAAAKQTPQKAVNTPVVVPPQRWAPAQAAQQAAQGRPNPTTSPVPLVSQKDKPQSLPFKTQPSKSATQIIRQAAAAAAANALTPSSKKISPVTAAPQTPGTTTPNALTRGFGTKWASHSTPSTPRPIAAEPESPAYEPVSPPPRAPSILSDTPRSVTKRDSRGVAKIDTAARRPRGRPPRTAQRGRGASTTPSVAGTRRSQSIASQADELSMDHPVSTTKIKHEVLTPRNIEETGDTTADESVHGRTNIATPGSVSSRPAKRKRQDTPSVSSDSSTQVLWTRGFTKVSSSALDQISSHRDANMFATCVRERDAPGYRQIVLQPQDITSIRAAIKQGNKAAVQAASSLSGGDPGTASVWLPMSEDLVPPKGIINSAQLERELVHMFCNAIMYNPDPNRGPGAAFLKRNRDEEEEIVGYHVDENGVVKNTRSMFVEVEKLLGDLRSAEKERGAPPPSATRQASVTTPADDTAEDEDELAGDGNTATSVVKRRRIATRN
ncbi:hypothetical protein QQS21_008930 [Conoideocrella luteorostrata]|uniref:Bromo domain-containing protein n=1 Tax=Conoideocrella luteorostrata TaxID=1105319 RepID=A0AAJ0FY89_9HYPO|nr:hypothetical protein QQS21_008930 [Conoideocrella luteorostrata]